MDVQFLLNAKTSSLSSRSSHQPYLLNKIMMVCPACHHQLLLPSSTISDSSTSPPTSPSTAMSPSLSVNGLLAMPSSASPITKLPFLPQAQPFTDTTKGVSNTLTCDGGIRATGSCHASTTCHVTPTCRMVTQCRHMFPYICGCSLSHSQNPPMKFAPSIPQSPSSSTPQTMNIGGSASEVSPHNPHPLSHSLSPISLSTLSSHPLPGIAPKPEDVRSPSDPHHLFCHPNSCSRNSLLEASNGNIASALEFTNPLDMINFKLSNLGSYPSSPSNPMSKCNTWPVNTSSANEGVSICKGDIESHCTTLPNVPHPALLSSVPPHRHSDCPQKLQVPSNMNFSCSSQGHNCQSNCFLCLGSRGSLSQLQFSCSDAPCRVAQTCPCLQKLKDCATNGLSQDHCQASIHKLGNEHMLCQQHLALYHLQLQQQQQQLQRQQLQDSKLFHPFLAFNLPDATQHQHDKQPQPFSSFQSPDTANSPHLEEKQFHPFSAFQLSCESSHPQHLQQTTDLFPQSEFCPNKTGDNNFIVVNSNGGGGVIVERKSPSRSNSPELKFTLSLPMSGSGESSSQSSSGTVSPASTVAVVNSTVSFDRESLRQTLSSLSARNASTASSASGHTAAASGHNALSQPTSLVASSPSSISDSVAPVIFSTISFSSQVSFGQCTTSHATFPSPVSFQHVGVFPFSPQTPHLSSVTFQQQFQQSTPIAVSSSHQPSQEPAPLLPSRHLHQQASEAARDWTSSDDSRVLTRARAELEESGWYYGGLTWREAGDVLAGYPEGSFLVRDSWSGRCLYALSLQTARGPASVRIEYEKGEFRLQSETGLRDFVPQRSSVVALIQAYIQISSPAHVWTDHSGQTVSAISVVKPVRMNPSPLMHLARLAFNRSSTEKRAYSNLPYTLRNYLDFYPHSC